MHSDQWMPCLKPTEATLSSPAFVFARSGDKNEQTKRIPRLPWTREKKIDRKAIINPSVVILKFNSSDMGDVVSAEKRMGVGRTKFPLGMPRISCNHVMKSTMSNRVDVIKGMISNQLGIRLVLVLNRVSELT